MKNELASLQESAGFDVDDYEKKVAVLYDEINLLKDEEINLKDNCASLKEEIAVLQTQLVNIGGTELKKVHAKVKDLDDEFNGTKDSLHRLRNEKKTTQKALDKATASIQKAQDELQEIEKELQSFDKTGNSSNDHLRQEVEKLSCVSSYH
jgi:chromosome segregation ATPase